MNFLPHYSTNTIALPSIEQQQQWRPVAENTSTNLNLVLASFIYTNFLMLEWMGVLVSASDAVLIPNSASCNVPSFFHCWTTTELRRLDKQQPQKDSFASNLRM